MSFVVRHARAIPALLALGLLAAAAGSASAQGFFYVESEKDGRIYVFASAKEYQLWSRSGETGKAITRPGAGPRGETMIFDGEAAINLYNFKHDKPSELLVPPEEKKPVMKFGWKDGKTTFESDNASLVLSNRVQVRYTVEDKDTADPRGSFRIRRAKTKLEGWFFHRNLTYELQLNWPDAANPLEDAQLTYDLTGTKAFLLKVGQFKVPFGRQELTSSGSQQFVDRSIVSGEFAKGRDQGLQIGGLAANQKIDWRLGVFNGNGRTKSANDNDEYQWNGRVTFQPWGDVKYSEGDFESTDGPLVALAANFEVNDLRGVDPKAPASKRTIWGGDVHVKYRGFSALADYFHRHAEPEAVTAEDGTVTLPPEFDSDGWNVQVGYFVVPKRFEIAGRYAEWDPTDLKSGDDRTEKGVAFGWFFSKHPLKLQGDWRRIEDKAKARDKGRKTDEVRVQTQFIF